MCGIVGFLKTELREEEYESILQRMSNNIIHRGKYCQMMMEYGMIMIQKLV